MHVCVCATNETTALACCAAHLKTLKPGVSGSARTLKTEEWPLKARHLIEGAHSAVILLGECWVSTWENKHRKTPTRSALLGGGLEVSTDWSSASAELEKENPLVRALKDEAGGRQDPIARQGRTEES